MPIGGDENTHDNRRLDLLVTICVFAVASWITTSLRVYVRLRMIQGQSLRREDWVMVACQACFTLHFIFQGIGWHYGNGIHIADLETSNAEKALLHWWLAGMFYIWGSTLVKVSIGMLLLHFITNRFQRFLVYNVTFNCIVLGAAYSILLIFDCKPISYWWNLDPLAKGTCLPSKAFLIIGYVIAGLNAIADCTYAIVPFIIMSNTTMDVRTRAVVCGILGIGSITCIVTFIRIPFGHAFEGYKGDFLWATTPIAIFSTMELGLGIVAANCATFRPIFQHFFPNSFISHDAPPMAESAPTAHTHTDEEKAEPKPIVIAERKKPRFSRINAKTGIASLSGTEGIADIPDLFILHEIGQISEAGEDSRPATPSSHAKNFKKWVTDKRNSSRTSSPALHSSTRIASLSAHPSITPSDETWTSSTAQGPETSSGEVVTGQSSK